MISANTAKEISDKEYMELVHPYNDAMGNISARLDTLVSDYKYTFQSEPVHHIQKRIKSKDSIQDKLKRRGLEVDYLTAKENLLDIAGIRVICYFVQDIYRIAGLLKKQKDLEILKECDYIKEPKANGYRSYHIVFGVPIYHVMNMEYFPVEVQIRTMTMDLWASMEHRVCYKKDACINEERNDAFLKYARQLQSLEEELEKNAREKWLEETFTLVDK